MFFPPLVVSIFFSSFPRGLKPPGKVGKKSLRGVLTTHFKGGRAATNPLGGPICPGDQFPLGALAPKRLTLFFRGEPWGLPGRKGENGLFQNGGAGALLGESTSVLCCKLFGPPKERVLSQVAGITPGAGI